MMSPTPGWHPVIVHFPLALVVTAAACLTLVGLKDSARYAKPLAIVGTWNLCIGAIAVFFALGSGLAAAFDVHVGEAAHRAISAHLKSAVLSGMLVVAAGLWRGVAVAPDSRPSWLFLVLLWAATVSLVVTGYRGGQNVYRYGVGVAVGAVRSFEESYGAVPTRAYCPGISPVKYVST